MKGDVIVVRYADDFVVGFQHKWEAESFLNDLRGRLAKFGCVRLTDASVASESLAGRKEGSHHFHPEPCAGHREVSGEASVGACAGRAIEPRNG